MATYEVVILNSSAGGPNATELAIETGIDNFADGNTWNVTQQPQGAVKNTATYDVAIFPNAGIFNSQWSGAGDWAYEDIPMIVPGNRINSGTEAMSSNAGRGGSYTTADVLAAGAAHAIGVELGWTEGDTVDISDGGNQMFTVQSDVYSGVEVLLEDPGGGSDRYGLAVADTGAQLATDLATNRRMALNCAHDMATAASDANELLRVSLLWLMDELGGAVAQVIAATAFNQSTSTTSPSSDSSVGRTVTPVNQPTSLTTPTLISDTPSTAVTSFDQTISLATPSAAAGAVEAAVTSFDQLITVASPTASTTVDQVIAVGSIDLTVTFITPTLTTLQLVTVTPFDVPISLELRVGEFWIRNKIPFSGPTKRKVSPYKDLNKRRRFQYNG